jgi:hypothetical protein
VSVSEIDPKLVRDNPLESDNKGISDSALAAADSYNFSMEAIIVRIIVTDAIQAN